MIYKVKNALNSEIKLYEDLEIFKSVAVKNYGRTT